HETCSLDRGLAPVRSNGARRRLFRVIQSRCETSTDGGSCTMRAAHRATQGIDEAQRSRGDHRLREVLESDRLADVDQLVDYIIPWLPPRDTTSRLDVCKIYPMRSAVEPTPLAFGVGIVRAERVRVDIAHLPCAPVRRARESLTQPVHRVVVVGRAL